MAADKVHAALVAVLAGMLVLFLLPASYFVPATFGATAVMLIAAAWVRGGVKVPRPEPWAIAVGLASAVVLYAIFYLGNAGVNAVSIPGLGKPDENSIYSLVSSPSNPLAVQVALLGFDAAGYEAFFRGTLQSRLKPRLGPWGAPAVAALDALIHLATLNLLWVATTFVADTVWGLTYHYGRGAQSSSVSHFAWDIAVFILAPIR